MKYIRKIRNILFGFAILFIALGVFMVVEPHFSSSIICYIFGSMILLCGLIDLINYFVNTAQQDLFRFDLIKGATLFLLGIFIIVKNSFVTTIFPIIFGLVILVDGIAKMFSSFDIKKGHQKIWIVILCLGFLISTMGVVIIFHPFSLNEKWMMIIGISLVVDGLSSFWCNICLKKHIENNYS
jgi:uncharacterized membrane protein HdeD (DUF308 family)